MGVGKDAMFLFEDVDPEQSSYTDQNFKLVDIDTVQKHLFKILGESLGMHNC
jgi:hypothetical protein